MTGLFETLSLTYRLDRLHVLTLFIRRDPGNITEIGKKISPENSEIFIFFVNVVEFRSDLLCLHYRNYHSEEYSLIAGPLG